MNTLLEIFKKIHVAVTFISGCCCIVAGIIAFGNQLAYSDAALLALTAIGAYLISKSLVNYLK